MKWLALPLLLAASTAHANQCAWVSSDIAEHAKDIVANHAVSWFCQTCGGSYEPPGEPKVPTNVGVYMDPDRGAAVKIDGIVVDLSYVYVQTSPRRYDNVGLLVGCPAIGEAPGLRVEDATDHGVLIVPDDAPPERTPAPLPPTRTVLLQPTGLGWGAIAAGCGATSALWLAALCLRRRRQHRPRLG